MAATNQKDGLTISKFFIFDSRLGPTEDTEHEKILFYYPASTHIDQQQSDVGLTEALINFTKTFSPDKPCSAFYTDKTRQAFWEPEPCIWMILIVKKPQPPATKSGSSKDDKQGDIDISDEILSATLKNAYQLFCMFNGTFKEASEAGGAEGLRRKLSLLFPSFIATSPPISKLDLGFSLRGIRYFPVDRQTFLGLQSFFHLAQQDFRTLKYGICLYQDMLVWSTLPTISDTGMIYNYLVTQVAEIEADGGRGRNRSLPPARDPEAPAIFNPYNRIWILPLDLGSYAPQQLSSIAAKIPLVYLGRGDKVTDTPAVCHLVLFKQGQLLWSFLFDESESISSNLFLQQFASFISSPVRAFHKTLANLESRTQMGAEEPNRYLYFNQMNLALKDSLRQGGGKGSHVTPETSALMLEMHAALSGTDHGNEPPGAAPLDQPTPDAEDSFKAKAPAYKTPTEMCVKSSGDGWIVGKKSNGRELYVVSDNKASNIVEVGEEVERISANYFSNIFL